MMSENYNDFKRAYHPNSIFFHAVSKLCYYKVGTKDICKIGRIYAIYKNSDIIYKDGKTHNEWLKEGVKHDIYDCDMRCMYKDSIGTNFEVMQKACEDIREEILNKPKENKELFIKGILSDFSATYKLIEPIFTKPQYKAVMEILDEDRADFELPSEEYEEFVSWAFTTYQRFVNNLYIICLENGFNLEEIQVKYSLPISYSWDWKYTDYNVSQEEFDAMCSKLKQPFIFNFRKENEDIFVCKRNDKELHRIHKELQERGYIKGSVYDFVAIMKGEECSAKLEWKLASTRRPKDPSPIALRDFLQLMGCNLKQAQIIANNYFGKSLPRYQNAESEHHKELYQIVNKM